MNSASISTDRSRGRLAVRDLVILALLSALMIGSKVALIALPNVHLSAVFILLAVLLFGRRSLYAVFVYVFLEGIIYGFGVWFITYLYAWPLLVLVALPLRSNRSWLLWAVLAATHGLIFGLLCAIPYIFIMGFPGAVAWWIGGLPYDCLHAGSNLVLTLVLLKPLYRICAKVMGIAET